MSTNLEPEIRYFLEHRDELAREYNGKILLIRGQKVQGVYTNQIEAYDAAQKEFNFELGTFLIPECIAEKKEHPYQFYSRVYL